MRRSAGALAAGVVALAPLPALAATPAPGPYRQTVECVAKGIALPPVTQGVSYGQRALRWAALEGLSTGRGVTVAVIDSGVNPVAAFGSRVVGGGDDVDPANGRNGLVDCDGHGTVVAGLVAASPDPATGFAGVAPDARILSIRQTSARYEPVDRADGKGVGDAATLSAAIDSAVAQGARVINISAAICGPRISLDQSALRAAVARALDHDVVVVAAAGNVGEGACTQNPLAGDEPTAALPAAVDGVLAVGAVTTAGAPASYSLRGSWVSLAAPGDHLVSVNPHPDGRGQVDTLLTQEGQSVIQGTSFSAPLVAGVAALVRARYPQLSARQVIHRLEATAMHPPGAGGRNRSVGFGVVDPRMALTAVLPEEGPAGAPAAAARQTGIAAPPAVVDDPLPRLLALGGTGLLGLAVVAFALTRIGRRPR